MVVMAAGLPAEEEAALMAAKGLKLVNIKRHRRLRKDKPRSLGYRRRRNDDSCHNAPEGFYQCPSASCDLHIPASEFLNGEVTCSAGHFTDLKERELQELLSPGGIALVGVTNTQQGRIAEQVVWDIHDLGEFGVLDQWLSHDVDHNSTFDMVTSTGLPVEVRSVSTRAANQAFALSAGKKRRMNIEMRRRKARGQIGVLVILDFVTMTANIYLRFMERAIYFERPKKPFITQVPFTNPYAEIDRTQVPDDIPF